MSFLSGIDKIEEELIDLCFELGSSDWDEIRKKLRSKDRNSIFVSTNFCAGRNAFHEVCKSGEHEIPVDILASILAIDERNLTRTTKDEFRATPLHLACDSYATPDFVKMLLSLRPDKARAMVCATDSRGYNPIDCLWLKMIKLFYVDYVLYDRYLGTAVPTINGLYELLTSTTSDCSDEFSERGRDLKESLSKTMIILYAASLNGRDEIPASWSAVHAIASASVRCPNLVLWFALKKHPNQVSLRDEDGNLPLHLAAACRNHYRYPLTSKLDEEGATISTEWEEGFPEKKGRTKIVMDVIQASPVKMLVEMYPRAASSKNEAGRLPLHVAVERGAEWAGEVEPLFAAFPGALNQPDPETRLLPFMLAAVGLEADASVQLAYMLLRSNPANVASGIRSNVEQERKVDNKPRSTLKRKAFFMF